MALPVVILPAELGGGVPKTVVRIGRGVSWIGVASVLVALNKLLEVVGGFHAAIGLAACQRAMALILRCTKILDNANLTHTHTQTAVTQSHESVATHQRQDVG